MTGPGGTKTKRDDRRDSRRAQFQQRQLERQRERARQLRNQRIIRGAITGGGVLVLLLALFLVIHAMTGGGSSSIKQRTGPHDQFTTPANGEVRAGMSCLASEGTGQHFHAYVYYYVDGKQVNIPDNTGIVNNQCLYALHTHPGEPNIIHIEAPNQDPYYLGDFFAIWGQYLSPDQVGDHRADAKNKLEYWVIDQGGKPQKVTGDPWNLQFQSHQTIYILYNSPNVQLKPFTNWGDL